MGGVKRPGKQFDGAPCAQSPWNKGGTVSDSDDKSESAGANQRLTRHWVSKLGSYCNIDLGGQDDGGLRTNAVAGKALGRVVLSLSFFSFSRWKPFQHIFFSVSHVEKSLVERLREENNKVLTRFYKITFWPQWRNNYDLIVLK